jgi:hypothetical protein
MDDLSAHVHSLAVAGTGPRAQKKSRGSSGFYPAIRGALCFFESYSRAVTGLVAAAAAAMRSMVFLCVAFMGSSI